MTICFEGKSFLCILGETKNGDISSFVTIFIYRLFLVHFDTYVIWKTRQKKNI